VDFDLDQSVRIFSGTTEFWAMDKTTAISTTFENYNLMDVHITPFCGNFSTLYGTTNPSFDSIDSSQDNDGSSISLSGLFH
jgi:hypothetical protein